MLQDVFLAGSARTAIGTFCGAFWNVPAPRLGSVAVEIDEVIFGNVLSAGLGQNVARQASLGAGLPSRVGATTINKVCGSSLKAVMLAAQAIQCDDAQLVVAGGTENMSAAPYLLPKARGGYRMGNGELVDSLIRDGLWDVYNDLHMGACGDRCAEKCEIPREAQDDFAVASYRRAIKARQEGVFGHEIVPVQVAGRKGTVAVDRDEEPTRFNEQKLRKLGPAFSPEGSVTAGNASSISDGAAAVLVLSGAKREQLGVAPEARILGYATFSREPEWFTLAPVGAVAKLMDSLGWTTDDVDLFEVNEAFSVVPLAVMKELGVPHEKMNVHGGAVALGHPIGASGARVVVTLLNALKHRRKKTGIASLCIGGGEAVALAIERC
ncbi:MAG: thiolase family protein [Planctomycetota bacterium]|jgi:acetyl-CoA C-acetyltransferase